MSADLATLPAEIQGVKNEVERLREVANLPANAPPPAPRNAVAGKRGRAAALEQRMLRHRSIYNSVCVLRDAWAGSEARRAECMETVIAAFLDELQKTEDREACIYALCDAMYCSPLGVPWES